MPYHKERHKLGHITSEMINFLLFHKLNEFDIHVERIGKKESILTFRVHGLSKELKESIDKQLSEKHDGFSEVYGVPVLGDADLSRIGFMVDRYLIRDVSDSETVITLFRKRKKYL